MQHRHPSTKQPEVTSFWKRFKNLLLQLPSAMLCVGQYRDPFGQEQDMPIAALDADAMMVSA
jgi:menaquinone-dependent protoporphyrinogen IX oxidase